MLVYALSTIAPPRPAVSECCVDSVRRAAYVEGFRIAQEGGAHACDTCGRYWTLRGGKWIEAFRCPRPGCGAVSHNPNDLRHRYCGRCHRFADDL